MQNNWVQLLPVAQFAYNNAITATTKVTPFYASYGLHPQPYYEPIRHSLRSTSRSAVEFSDRIKELHRNLQLDLQFLAQRAANYYNKNHRQEPTLKEGDKVRLLTRNIRTKRPSKKLDFKKYGPFKITKVISPVTYELQLPKKFRNHNVFHISLLEPVSKHQDPRTEPSQPSPIELEEEETEEYELEAIVDDRDNERLHRHEYRVKWTGYPGQDTWEPADNIPAEIVRDYHRTKEERHR